MHAQLVKTRILSHSSSITNLCIHYYCSWYEFKMTFLHLPSVPMLSFTSVITIWAASLELIPISLQCLHLRPNRTGCVSHKSTKTCLFNVRLTHSSFSPPLCSALWHHINKSPISAGLIIYNCDCSRSQSGNTAQELPSVMVSRSKTIAAWQHTVHLVKLVIAVKLTWETATHTFHWHFKFNRFNHQHTRFGPKNHCSGT